MLKVLKTLRKNGLNDKLDLSNIYTNNNSIPSNSAYLSKFTHELLTPYCTPDITSHKHLVPKLQIFFFGSRKFVFLKTVLWLKLIEKIVQFHLQVPSQLLNI